MQTQEPRYSKEEYRQRGESLYENSIRAQVEPQHNGKFVAIDLETGDYEVDEDDYTAGERLLARHPDAQTWMMRAGHKTAYRMGGRSRMVSA